MALTGTEVLWVVPVQSNGRLGAIQEQTTTGAIAALAGGTSDSVAQITTNTTAASSDTGKTYTNPLAVADVIVTLPAAVKGLTFSAYVAAAYYLELLAVGTDVINLGATIGAAAGNVTSNTVGYFITLRCLVTGKWSTTSASGGWILT